MHFILTNSAKHDLDESSLVQEVQQLGLPKESAEIVGKQFLESKDDLRARFALESYSLPKLKATEWRVDSVIASSSPCAASIAHLKLTLDTRPQDDVFNNLKRLNAQSGEKVDGSRVRELAFELTSNQLDSLVVELTKAQNVLDNLDC